MLIHQHRDHAAFNNIQAPAIQSETVPREVTNWETELRSSLEAISVI